MGFKVSAAAQGSVMGMCYYLHHMITCVNRPTTNHPQVTLASVFSLNSQTQLEEGHKGPLTLPTANFKDLPKTKETIEEYIWEFRGVEKSFLGYIIRENIYRWLQLPTWCGVPQEVGMIPSMTN